MHTLLPILVHGIRCAYGQVAEEAEAMAPMGLLLKLCNACGTGMMAWGPDRAECIASLHSLHKYHMVSLGFFLPWTAPRCCRQFHLGMPL